MDHIEQILANPMSHDLMWTLRVIEARYLDLPRIGDSQTLKHDPVRLDQAPSLKFASSEINQIRPCSGGYHIEINNFGLWGPNGALPLSWTASARDRQHHSKDPTLVRFGAVFHHRMISLFYKAWSRSRKVTDFDRPSEQRFTNYLGSLAGVANTAFSRGLSDVPGFAKIYYSGLLGRFSRDPHSLVSVLSDYFGVSFHVEEYVARWLEVSAHSRSSLSGEGAQLGSGAMLGERCWDCETKFRVLVGPLDRKQLERFALRADAFELISSWLQSWVGVELEWELRLMVKGEAAPCAQLGGSTLGRNTWTFSESLTGVVRDVVLEPYSPN